MTHYIFDSRGNPVGFWRGMYVYELTGRPVGQLRGTRVHKLRGDYVGELHHDIVVDMHLGNLGNIGYPGHSGHAGHRVIPETAVPHRMGIVTSKLLE